MHSVGAVIGGKYRLLRLLGEGAMGAVWAARNEVIGRDVAIKMMQPHLTRNADSLRRFFNEARICASIRAPGIVDVLDMGTAEDGSPFIVMELLDGQPLQTIIDRHGGRLSLASIVPVIRDVAETLELAHKRGVVHRDIKPANLFLHRAGKSVIVKILDFGVSKVLDDGSPYATRTGSVLGSPAYMSPEQAAGNPVDHRSDIYSLGVILYEATCGLIPFHDAPNTNALLVALATRAPPSLASISPGTDPALAAVVARSMEREAAQRFQTSAEFACALGTVLERHGAAPSVDLLSIDHAITRHVEPEAGRDAPPPSTTTPDVVPIAFRATEPSGAHRALQATRVPPMAASTAAPTSSTHRNLTAPSRRRPWGIALAAGLVVAGAGSVWALAHKSSQSSKAPASEGSRHEPSSSAAATSPDPTAAVRPPVEVAVSSASAVYSVAETIASATASASALAPTSTGKRTGPKPHAPTPPPPPTIPTRRKADDFR